jgi:hypothetical protein
MSGENGDPADGPCRSHVAAGKGELESEDGSGAHDLVAVVGRERTLPLQCLLEQLQFARGHVRPEYGERNICEVLISSW